MMFKSTENGDVKFLLQDYHQRFEQSVMFDKAFDLLIELEGFKANVKDDPGGRTVYGISEKSHPDQVKQMWDMSQKEAKPIAKSIYREEYWQPVQNALADVPYSVIISWFDAAVNQGTGWVNHQLEYKNSYSQLPTNQQLEIVSHKRIAHYYHVCRGNNGLVKFMKGWTNRLLKVENFCLKIHQWQFEELKKLMENTEA